MTLADVKETIVISLDQLRANKLRSGLTVLGIVIGVLTVIIMSSVINGLNGQVNGIISQLGSNTLFVFRFEVFGKRPTLAELARKQLTYEDMMSLQDLPHVVAADAGLRYADFTFGGGGGMASAKAGTHKQDSVGLAGENFTSPEVNDWHIDRGRFFTQDEQNRAAKVVLLGHDTAEELFPDESPLGKEVTIPGMTATVIGTLEAVKGITPGKNPNDSYVYMPLTTFHNLHPEVLDYWISVKYDDAKNRSLVEEEIRERLRIRRKVTVDKDDNFVIFGSDSLSRLWAQLTDGLFLLMFALSSVGLMVGGVGVMNIMLVSVTERTREIGVRKAIGATKRTILLQFTLEAMVLCAVGGLIGITLGSLIALGMGVVLPSVLSSAWVIAAFTVSIAIGLVFGIYPAWKAASLNPIEALRYE
ncbi:ABC transporter permease [Terriglobus sp. ADX1]|uniref:ABC transporter permease n=1 Tax=Terriglobus sp. ADX1 TaxID=2794063 RepID=UPI002FE5DEC8